MFTSRVYKVILIGAWGHMPAGEGLKCQYLPFMETNGKTSQFVTLTVQKSMVAKGKNIETFTYCFYTEFALYNHLFGVPPLHPQT